MGTIRAGFLALAALTVASCGTYSTAFVDPVAGASAAIGNGGGAKTADQIILTEGDITDRKYVSLGDIRVTVRKLWIFDFDPTRADVRRSLQEKAAELGADGVVFVRYGTLGVGLISWGQMEGAGRAVRFP